MQRGADITHRAREESALFVDLEERGLDLSAGDVSVVVGIEDAECFLGFLGSIVGGLKVGREEETAFAVLEGGVDQPSQTLFPDIIVSNE